MVIPVSDVLLESDFDVYFRAMTGSEPYPWQRKLFALFSTGKIPPDINLPTGSGKTSIMIIWLLALARQAAERAEEMTVPRRLVWVVNRRVVVDQATEEAEHIRKRLGLEARVAELESVRGALRSLSGCDDGELIAISTLRGEKEDNREWSNDPSRPAIIVGTVDMIGSRLLFSGYGDGRYWRAQHAGLIGHDTLIVNDEAHLTPAFGSLLSKVQEKQRSSVKPFRTVRLSATHPGSECWPNSLEDDRKDERFRRVFEAPKKLQIRDAGKQFSTMLELAVEPGPARTLIFVERPDKVTEIAEKLKEKLKKIGESVEPRILTLTGTMRGIERDRIVESAVFKAFAGDERPANSCWLIATSAGEVGINISADRLITELDTLDHLLQRFGRLNRFGETIGTAYVLVGDMDKADKKKERKAAAMDFLRKLEPNETDDPDGKESYNISPAALFGRELPPDACEEIPLQAELHDWLIDVWSQTSLGRHPARPQVEPWLHGKKEDVPETYTAWREDVRYLVQDGIADDEREEALQKYRLLAHEQLREPTTKLLTKLEELAHGQPHDTSFLRRKTDGSVDVLPVCKFAEIRNDSERKRVIAEIAYCQLVLPVGCGSIRDGMFVPLWGANEETSNENGNNNAGDYDVSGRIWKKDEPASIGRVVDNPDRASYRATRNEEGGWTIRRLGVAEEQTEPMDNLELERLHKFAAARGWRFRLKIAPENDNGDVETALLYFGKTRKKTESVPVVFVDEHCKEVADVVKKIATCASLSEEVALALQRAAQLHDLGKQESLWQWAAGNLRMDGGFEKGKAVAKPIKVMQGRMLGGFRHELASLRYAEETFQTDNFSAELRDLALHLLAAHHGHARPCFERKAYDRNPLTDSERIALESAQRFARLQERFGPWGLAYLESILRAADGMVSASCAEEQPNNA